MRVNTRNTLTRLAIRSGSNRWKLKRTVRFIDGKMYRGYKGLELTHEGRLLAKMMRIKRLMRRNYFGNRVLPNWPR